MSRPIVLHLISPTGYYGAERWVVAQARHCDPGEVEVHIAATRESGDPLPEILARSRELGLPSHEILLNGRFDPAAVMKTARLARRLNASILHGHGYKSDLLAVLARRSARARVVATPHGFERATGLKLRMYLAAGRWALRRCDAVAPLSSELHELVLEMGVDPARIHLIENGVDLSEIDPLRSSSTGTGPQTMEDILPAEDQSSTGDTAPPTANRSSHPRQKDCLAYVGRLVPLKNLESMLRAFDALCRLHDSARLLLIGEGPEENNLRALADSLPAARGRVGFLGYREDRLEILQRCSIFTMTSRLEGIPRSMMEAMALGLPAVAYSIPGVDRLLLEEETGLSAPLDQVEDLAAAYLRLLNDHALRRRLGEGARVHIQKNFSARRVAKEYETLYRDLVSPTI